MLVPEIVRLGVPFWVGSIEKVDIPLVTIDVMHGGDGWVELGRIFVPGGDIHSIVTCSLDGPASLGGVIPDILQASVGAETCVGLRSRGECEASTTV